MSEIKVFHKSVLVDEVLEYSNLKGKKDALVFDMNLGEGGHTERILEKFPFVKVIGVDADSDIVERANERLKPFNDRFKSVVSWSDEFLSSTTEEPDLILFDLGLSMYHYKNEERGFSFGDDTLDMRFSKDGGLSAKDVVNTYKENDLADVLYKYGDEKKSRAIARAIVNARKTHKIESASELHTIITSCFPYRVQRESKTDVATRSFQALRIEVNNELGRFKRALESAYERVKICGRIEVISFHSLEDGIAKWYFRSLLSEGKVKILTKKPITPSDTEIEINNASRSSKLRVVEKER